MAGLHDSVAVAESVGWQHGLQVEMTPIGAYMLFGVPMHMLANRIVEVADLLGQRAATLAEQLDEAADWEGRFTLLDSLLASRLAAACEPSPAIAWAWRRLCQTDGRLGIGALAEELGASRQYLASGFREQIGLPPKTLGRILRLQRALRLFELVGEPRLTAVAHDCGYYDQAHFNRDFRQLTGATPTEFLAARLPDGAGVARS